MSKHELDIGVYYDITDKPERIGMCEICDCSIYDGEEHYDFEREYVCVDCIDDYTSKFHRC